ncbi:VOC family protein [Burkholderia perseverans]|uniref:VOC family protein n=1 Tax=Burkholderia perseverans TaxID=2615214 RepID=UPI001FEEA5D5|nr:VOC family protein [Burkholderia perseverans]
MTTTLPPVLGLHHFAWRCRNAEETRHFYEDILGLPLVHLIRLDRVPSTGEYCPYVHLFFEMADGSNIAFFDLGDDTAAEPSPNTPPWVNHIALRLATLDQLETMKQRLVEHGIEVLGVTDHHFVRSIYFFDPNGFRLELTVPVAPAETLERYRGEAHGALRDWLGERGKSRPETPRA